MSRALRYHPLFDSDVLNAATWYDGRHPELGSDFVVRVRRAVEQMTADPESRTASDFGVRYWPVQRFPYVVLFDLTKSEILILGVMHTAQDATKWLLQRQ